MKGFGKICGVLSLERRDEMIGRIPVIASMVLSLLALS